MDEVKTKTDSDIISTWKKINEEDAILSPKLKNKQLAAYQYFVQSVNDLTEIFRRVDKGNIIRQSHMEEHCLHKPITLKQHEKYHDVSNQLLSDLRTFFLLYKTCLNSLVLLLRNIIPESRVRGLRFRSFGSLAKSASKIHFDALNFDELRRIIEIKGIPINDDILSYRDKFIEHPQNPIRGVISTINRISKILHIKSDHHSDNIKMDKEIIHKKDTFICFVNIKVESKGIYFYYHIKSSLKPGQPVSINHSMGKVYDNTIIHFQKHGSHFHVFGPPGELIKAEEVMGSNDYEAKYSPSPEESLLKLYELIKDIMVWLNCNVTNIQQLE